MKDGGHPWDVATIDIYSYQEVDGCTLVRRPPTAQIRADSRTDSHRFASIRTQDTLAH